MAAPAVFPQTWQWSPEVLVFAEKHQARPYLHPLLEVTQRLYPTANHLKVNLAGDPEIRDDWHIVFDVQVPQSDVPDYGDAQRRWTQELFSLCPAPLVWIFRLCLDVVPA